MRSFHNKIGSTYRAPSIIEQDDTQTSRGTSGTSLRTSPPQRVTRSAQLHPAVSPNGYYHTQKFRSSTPPDMEQPRTLYTPEGYPTPPPRTRPPSTSASAPSSSSKSDFAGTSAATPNSKPRPRSMPPSSRPSRNTGGMWSSSPSLYATQNNAYKDADPARHRLLHHSTWSGSY